MTAYISGALSQLEAVLKAGIENFGTSNETEQVAINHNGTGHFGNLYFNRDYIDFRQSATDKPYLTIGGQNATFIDDFLSSARLNDTPISISSTRLYSNVQAQQWNVSAPYDGTRITIRLNNIRVEAYYPSKIRLTLDGQPIAEWQGITQQYGSPHDETFTVEQVPYEASNLQYQRTVSKGAHTVRLEIVDANQGARAFFNGFSISRYSDTGVTQSYLSKSGLRLYGSPTRYLDVDYRDGVWMGSGLAGRYASNPYTVRIAGGAKVDKLTAEELDVPGVPLCGATFNENGAQQNFFGKSAKRQGGDASATYYSSGRFYRVYHSIGHTNYIPMVQVYGVIGNNYYQSLTARVDAVDSNSFAVRIIPSNNQPIMHAFSYVAFKTVD